jgi:hypothetical protein
MNNDPNPSVRTTRRSILQASILAPLVSAVAAADVPTAEAKPSRDDIFLKHDFEPKRYVELVLQWAKTLPA